MGERLQLNRIQFIPELEVRITDTYKLERQIGEGVSGSVFLATHKTTGEQRAIKQILKSKLAKSVHEAREEIEVLKTLDHPSIIRLHETYEDRASLYLVTEYLSGGDLFDSILASDQITESVAANVFR